MIEYMAKIISISTDIFKRIEKHITSFSDTPETVITRLLDFYENSYKTISVQNGGDKKDYTRYKFNNEIYKKNRLVLAVVKFYLENNRNPSYENLLEVFPKILQGSIGVCIRLDEAIHKIENSPNPKTEKTRYFLSDVISLLDGEKIVVCTQCSGQIKLLTFLRDFRQLFVAFLLQTLFQIQQGLAHLKHYALFGSYTSLSTGQFWLSSA